MHPVFHVSLLKPVKKDERLQLPPPRLLPNVHVVFTMDRILDHCKSQKGLRRNLTEFLVRWEGSDKTRDSWEPEALIRNPKVVQDCWDYVAFCEQHTT